MASRSELASLPGRVERVCATAASDDRRLRLAVLAEVRRSIPFDAYAWVLTDPRTSVGSAPMADVPCLPELPTLIRLKYGTDVNRWTSLAGAGSARRTGVATLQASTHGDPERSLLWRELLCRYAVTDVASLAFVDGFGCWAFLDLWRASPASPFDAAERVALAALLEPVAAALRTRQAGTFAVTGAPSTELAGAAVLLLGDDLQVLSQTDATQAVLRSLNPPGDDRPPIPAAAYNVGAQLHAVEAGVDDHEPSARVHLGDGLWITLRAARIRPVGQQEAAGIAVSIEQTSPADRVDLFARAFGLTPRETQLVNLVVDGADTRRVSATLFISEYTVQDHLKAVFTKAGVRSRTALRAQVLGHRSEERVGEH